MGTDPATPLPKLGAPTFSWRAAAPRRFLSVGSKLAGATIALMVLVTAVVFAELSAYQREHLLQAKQMAALAVTRLFADSCAAPIVFGDRVAISDALQRLGKSDDIPYAAVWSSSDSADPGEPLAEVGKRSDIALGPISAVVDLRREPTRLVLQAPVTDVDGRVVGAALVAFSLVRENSVIAQVRTNTLFASGAIAIGLTMLLLIIARVAIVKPLGKLAVAANSLEHGVASDIQIRSHDEIGQLAAAFRTMARAITTREERIVARNRDMRLVLDNVGQGFLTLDVQARLSEERSRVVETWFGVPEPGITFGAYLARLDPKAGERFEVGWMLVTDTGLPPELNLDHLPQLMHTDARVFELSYKPISKAGNLEQMLVVITDVTVRVERERALAAERETMSIFRRMVSDRGVFEEFFEEASALVSTIISARAGDRSALQLGLHTLKGSAAVYGIESIAELCHAMENELDGMAGVLSDASKAKLADSWARIARIRAEFAVDSGITLPRDEHRALLHALESRGQTDLATRLAAWQNEPAARRLELIGRQIRLLAQRLGKGQVQVRVEPTELRLPPRLWAPLWNVLSHMVRNTVDHGLESPRRRIELGKSEQPTVVLALQRADGELVWSIQDDGRGIDWATIAKRGRSRGLPIETPRDLQAALFTAGVSSKDEVTATSGRGLGLSAVHEVVSSLGGRIEVWSEPNKGTKFVIHLPLSMLAEERGQAREPSASGSPGTRSTASVPA
jgi:two-component system, chemotaxis family, sensor kinase CheA